MSAFSSEDGEFLAVNNPSAFPTSENQMRKRCTYAPEYVGRHFTLMILPGYLLVKQNSSSLLLCGTTMEVKDYLNYLVKQTAAPGANDFPIDPQLLKEGACHSDRFNFVAYKLAHKYGLYGAKLAFLAYKLYKMTYEYLNSLLQNPSRIEHSLSGLKTLGFGESWHAFAQGRHDFSSEGANALFAAIDELQDADLTEKANLKEWLALWGRHLCNIRRETVRALARRCLLIFRRIRHCDAELLERHIKTSLAQIKKVIPSFELSDVFVGASYDTFDYTERDILYTHVPGLLSALLFPAGLQCGMTFRESDHLAYKNTSAETFLDWIENTGINPRFCEYMDNAMFVEPIIDPAYSNYLYKSICQSIEGHKQGHHTGYSFICQGKGSGKTKTVFDFGSRCILLKWDDWRLCEFQASDMLFYIFATFTVLKKWIENPRILNAIDRYYPNGRSNFLKTLSKLHADDTGCMGKDYRDEVRCLLNDIRWDVKRAAPLNMVTDKYESTRLDLKRDDLEEYKVVWFEKIRILMEQVKEMLRTFPGVPSGELPIIFFFDDSDGYVCWSDSFAETRLGLLTKTSEAFKGLGHFIFAGENFKPFMTCDAFNKASGEKRKFGLYTDLPYFGQIPMQTKNIRSQPSVISDSRSNVCLHYYPLDCVTVGRPSLTVRCNEDSGLGSDSCLQYIIRRAEAITPAAGNTQTLLFCTLGIREKGSMPLKNNIGPALIDAVSEDTLLVSSRYPTEPVIATVITQTIEGNFRYVDQLLKDKIMAGEIFNILKGMRGANLAGYSFLMAKLLLDRNELHIRPRSLWSTLKEMYRYANEAEIPTGFIAFNTIRRCTVAVTKEVLYEAWRRRVLLQIDSTELIMPMIVAQKESQVAVACAENATGVVIKAIDTCIAPFSPNGTSASVDEEFRKVTRRTIESIKSRGFAPILLLMLAGDVRESGWLAAQTIEGCTVMTAYSRVLLMRAVSAINKDDFCYDAKYHWVPKMAPTTGVKRQFDSLGKEAEIASNRILANWGMHQRW